MLIEVKDEALGGLQLTREQALLDFAVGLYTDGRVTLGRAAGIALRSQADFQKELGRRGISIHYEVQDLREDVETLAALREK